MLTQLSPPTLISEGTRVQGDLIFFSHAHVFGIVEGALAQQSLEPIHVGKTGWVSGDIRSRGPILLEGRVDGDVESDTQIRVLATATVRGKISAPRVEIRAGAVLDGELSMPLPHPTQAPLAA